MHIFRPFSIQKNLFITICSVWRPKNAGHFHLVCWSESLEIGKHSCLSQLRMWLIRFFEIKIAPCHPDRWSEYTKVLCSSFCNYDVTWGRAVFRMSDVEHLCYLDSRMLMIWCLRVIKLLTVWAIRCIICVMFIKSFVTFPLSHLHWV